MYSIQLAVWFVFRSGGKAYGQDIPGPHVSSFLFREKNMVITESIQKAIQTAVRKSGSTLTFAQSIGVSHTTIANWVSGRTRKINSTVWQNLLPYIKDYLDPSETISYPSNVMPVGSTRHVLQERPAAWHDTTPVLTSVPLLRLADIADFDPQIDSMEDLIREKAKGTAVFTSMLKPGYFAVEVDESPNGYFPLGTRILLRYPEAPVDGDTVLVKLRNKKEFLFAVYTREKDGIKLAPLQKGNRSRTISKRRLHKVCQWLVSIREAIRFF